MQVVDKQGVVDDCAKLLDFNVIFLVLLIRELWLRTFRFGNIGCLVRKVL